MIVGFILLTVTVFLMILLIAGYLKKWESDILLLIFWLQITFAVIGSVLIGNTIGEKSGQIKALKGKFEYKMEVNGILKDSTFIPTDTTFIKIK